MAEQWSRISTPPKVSHALPTDASILPSSPLTSNSTSLTTSAAYRKHKVHKSCPNSTRRSPHLQHEAYKPEWFVKGLGIATPCTLDSANLVCKVHAKARITKHAGLKFQILTYCLPKPLVSHGANFTRILTPVQA